MVGKQEETAVARDQERRINRFEQEHGVAQHALRKAIDEAITRCRGYPRETPERSKLIVAEDFLRNLEFLTGHGSLDGTTAVGVLASAEDPDKMILRLSFLRHICDARCPFYSRHELRKLLSQFKEHLAINQSSLLQTGYPLNRFTPSPWMDWRLTDLNRIKIPFRADKAEGKYSYHWAREPIGWPLPSPLDIGAPFVADDGSYSGQPDVSKAENWTEVPYSDASPIPHLAKEKCDLIEQERSAFLKMKLEIIDVLCDALLTGECEGLLERCFSKIGPVLTERRFGYYNAFDFLFSKGLPEGARRIGPICGGINTLLMAIGHCEIEVRVGAISRTRLALEPYILVGKEGERRFAPGTFPVKESEWTHIDEAVRIYNDFTRNTVPVLEEALTMRIHHAVRTQLHNTVTVKVRIPARDTEKFEQAVRAYAERLATEMDEVVEADQGEGQVVSNVHLIRRKDDMYRFIFCSGEEFEIAKKKNGVVSVVMLIMNKGRWVRWQDLDSAEYTGHPFLVESVDSGVPVYVEDEQFNHLTGFIGEAINEKTKDQISTSIVKLKGELSSAKEDGDIKLVDEIEEQLSALRKYLSNATKGGSKTRMMIVKSEKLGRQRTTQRIGRVVEIMDKHNAKEASRLKNAITTSNGQYTYEPEHGTGWRVADN